MRSPLTGRIVWLTLTGIAIGWFESSVVVYLRELYYPNGFVFPLVVDPDHARMLRVNVTEVIREAASLLLLAGAARLAGNRFLERFGAFMFLFGVWDLTFYAFLRLVLGWPQSLATWDLLFLLPVPWAGPVWAPVAVSICLIVAGLRLYTTPDHPRLYRPRDWAIQVVSGLVVVVSMTWEWRTVAKLGVPSDFPALLFWGGLGLGMAWFLLAERRFFAALRGNLRDLPGD